MEFIYVTKFMGKGFLFNLVSIFFIDYRIFIYKNRSLIEYISIFISIIGILYYNFG